MGHEVVLIHVQYWLKEGSAAFATTVAPTVNDDPKVLSSDGLIQKKLRLGFMLVQLGMLAMSTTGRQREALRLNMKVVFILIYRKVTIVYQSQDIQKSFSLFEGLPHEFLGNTEFLVAREGRLLRANSTYFYE